MSSKRGVFNVGSLVWLFKEHRDLYQAFRDLERRLEDVEAWNSRRVSDLEEQLARKPAVDIPQLVEELFQDRPYDNGQIPDSAWLTPGLPDRTK